MNAEADGRNGDPGTSRQAVATVFLTAVPFVSAITICFVSILLTGSAYLVITNAAGDISAAFAMKGELPFTLAYMHSVALLPCREYLTALPDGRIRIDGTEFSGLGAGLPFDSSDGDFVLSDGSMRLSGMERYSTGITLLPSPFGGHTLTVGGVAFDMRKLAGAPGICTLSVRRFPVLSLPASTAPVSITAVQRQTFE